MSGNKFSRFIRVLERDIFNPYDQFQKKKKENARMGLRIQVLYYTICIKKKLHILNDSYMQVTIDEEVGLKMVYRE